MLTNGGTDLEQRPD